MCQFVLPAECLGEVRDMKTEDTYTSFSAIKCTVIDCRNRCIIGVCVFPWNWQTPIIICILVVKHLSTSDPQIKCHFFMSCIISLQNYLWNTWRRTMQWQGLRKHVKRSFIICFEETSIPFYSSTWFFFGFRGRNYYLANNYLHGL